MCFAYLFRIEVALAAFRTRFNIPQDVNVKFCPEGNIKNDKFPRVVFFPLMSILEGRVRFPMDLILLMYVFKPLKYNQINLGN